MNKLVPPPEPKISFRLSALTKKEVDDRVKKARAKSGPGGDGVSYKVYKYCSQLRHNLYVLLKQLWKEKTLVDTLTYTEGVYLPKEEDSAIIKPHINAQCWMQDLFGNLGNKNNELPA